jgi:hypothetical protein
MPNVKILSNGEFLYPYFDNVPDGTVKNLHIKIGDCIDGRWGQTVTVKRIIDDTHVSGEYGEKTETIYRKIYDDFTVNVADFSNPSYINRAKAE